MKLGRQNTLKAPSLPQSTDLLRLRSVMGAFWLLPSTGHDRYECVIEGKDCMVIDLPFTLNQ